MISNHSTQTSSITQDSNKGWNSSLFECCKDGEICWWTVWFPCLISARTTEVFGLGSSLRDMYILISVIALSTILSYTSKDYLTLLWIGYAIYVIFQRIYLRSKIREKLGIAPTATVSDCCIVCNCLSCAICQEAREAHYKIDKKVDYFSGQDLQELIPPNYSPVNGIMHSDVDTLNTLPTPLTSWHIFPFLASFVTSICSISNWKYCYEKEFSTTSKYLTVFWILATVFTFSMDSLLSVWCFYILAFLQPAMILHYFYFFRRWREYTRLDDIMKLFTVGFVFGVQQAVVITMVLLLVIIGIYSLQFPVLLQMQQIFTRHYITQLNGHFHHNITLIPSHTSLDKNRILLTSLHTMKDMEGSFLPMIPAILSHLLPIPPIATQLLGMFMSVVIVKPMDSGSSTTDDNDNTISSPVTIPTFISTQAFYDEMFPLVKEKFWILFVLLALCMYLGAALAEEYVKYATVKFFKFPYKLVNPYIIGLYFMAGALGFSTYENILYGLGSAKLIALFSRESALAWIYANPIFILFLRFLNPVHLICSILQAVNVTKVSLLFFFFVLPKDILIWCHMFRIHFN